MIEKIKAWFSGDFQTMETFLETEAEADATREQQKRNNKRWDEAFKEDPKTKSEIVKGYRDFSVAYRVLAVFSCIAFSLIMLYIVGHLPAFGKANPMMDEVAVRYIESGLEETGAVNIVAGMILDYRAFDTLGESFVLFTALVCATVLLRVDKKNLRSGREDYYTVLKDSYYDTSGDSILRAVGTYLVPFIMVFGIYVLLNGHISPGGGFSGGAILGAGLIILSASLGFSTADTILTSKRINLMTFFALGFYALSKCYVFFIGANGIHNPIPKGIPGAIFSAGLILPLNIAVGLVVACTMYGFYSLFRRGGIGNG